MIVSDINPSPNAVAGIVRENVTADAAVQALGSGSLVMARSNPALVKFAFQLLKRKISVKIIGETLLRDDLEATLGAHAGKSNAELLAVLGKEEASEKKKLMSSGDDRALTFVSEMYRCIRDMAEETPAGNVDGILTDIKDIFDGDVDENATWESNAILLSSVHRAKGKTKKSAWILAHSWISSLEDAKRKKRQVDKQEELNALYIAVTRSVDSLGFIDGNFKLLLDEIKSLE